MSRIHPSDQSRCHGHSLLRDHKESRRPLHDHDKHHQLSPPPTVLTVWKRSSMSFQGTDGFTVFDPNGTLVFRVDNYSRKNGYGLVLMDGVGNALLSLKPKVRIHRLGVIKFLYMSTPDLIQLMLLMLVDAKHAISVECLHRRR